MGETCPYGDQCEFSHGSMGTVDRWQYDAHGFRSIMRCWRKLVFHRGDAIGLDTVMRCWRRLVLRRGEAAPAVSMADQDLQRVLGELFEEREEQEGPRSYSTTGNDYEDFAEERARKDALRAEDSLHELESAHESLFYGQCKELD